MILSLMSFGDFHWLHNPLEIKIENRRLVYNEIHPQRGEKLYESGNGCRVITGRGELLGDDCIDKFRELYEVFKKGESRMLSLPIFGPIYAKFTALEVLGNSTPDLLTYSFEFTEADSFSFEERKEYVKAKEGETLFDIAFNERVSVDELVSYNPQIKRPDKLISGERVKLC